MSTRTLNPEPGPGDFSWDREDTHYPDRMSRWGAELFLIRQSQGVRDLCESTGFLFEEVRAQEIDGWVYVAVVPLGGKVRKAPPSVLVPLLVRVVPELRRRIATMRRQQSEGYWQAVVDRWLEGGEEALLAAGYALLDRDLADLTDAALADVAAEAWEYAGAAVKEHFHLHAAGINEIMRLSMELNRRHGFTTADLSGLLTGLSDTTTGPAAAQAEIVELVRRANGEGALRGASSLDEVRGISAEVDSAIADYLDSWGRRTIRYEVAYPTIAESPGWVLDTLKIQLDRPSQRSLDEVHRQTRADVERRVLDALGDTPAVRDRIARARRAFPIREGNESATVGVPAAVMRRIAQEAGRRLESAGLIESAGHVFDALPSEVDAALRGNAMADLGARAAARHADRLAPDQPTPPLRIGPEPVPPDVSGFPDDVRDVVEAALWFTSKASAFQTGVADADDVAAAPSAEAGPPSLVSGMGVAPGVYEGPARIILDESGFDRIQSGDILVCPITSPMWSMLFPSIGGLICDHGGPLSHPAIIAREFGIPAVVATGNATDTLEDGALVRIDGSTGAVQAAGAD